MTTLTNNDSPSTLTTSGLSLHIVQPGADDQVVSLPAGKCTVGSSDRCRVRLANRQVRPLHCLIIHDGAVTSVTRWAPGAQLNGQDFATAPFKVGDCLQIDDVQMSLVAAPRRANSPDLPVPQPHPGPQADSVANNALAAPPAVAANSAFAPATVAAEKPAVIETPLPLVETASNNSQSEPIRTRDVTSESRNDPARQLETDRLVSRLQIANSGARQRCRRLVASLRTMRRTASDFDQQVDDLEQRLREALEQREQIFIQLTQLQAAAAEQESQSSVELERLMSELTAAYDKASVAETAVADKSEQVEKLEAEIASLQGQREQWEQIRTAGELQRTRLAQALADHELRIESLQAEIEQVREAADKADESCRQQTAALEASQAELELLRTEREQFAAAQAESQQYQQEIEEALTDSEQNLAVFQLELEKFQLTSRQTEQELSQSNLDLERLQAEFALLSDERDQLATKRTEYQLREQGWEHELSSRDRQIEKLADEIEDLRATVATSDQDAAAHGSQVEAFQHQLEALTTERDLLLDTKADQAQQIQAWEETVAARERRIKELEEEHDGICQVLQSVEKGAFEQVDSCNKLESQLASLRTERDQLATAVPEQYAQIKQLQQALAERDGQITLLSDEFTRAAQRKNELETELAQGKSAAQALQDELAELNTHCQQLVAAQSSSDRSKVAVEQSLAEYQQRVEELQQQIEAIQQQRHELEQVVATGSLSKETFQAELNQLQAQYEQLRTEYQAETQRSQQLDEQLADQQQDVALYQVDLKSSRSELTRAELQVSELRTERETLKQQLTGLREELAAQEKVGETVDVQLQQQRDQLAGELEHMSQLYQQSQSDLERMEQSLHTAEQALQEHLAGQAEIDDLAGEATSEVSPEPIADPWEIAAKAEPGEVTPAFHDDRAIEAADETEEPTSPATDERVTGDSTGESAGIDEVAKASAEWAQSFAADSETTQDVDVPSPASDDLSTDELVISETIDIDEDADSSAEWAQPFAASEETVPATPAVPEVAALDLESPAEPAEEFQPPSFIEQYQHLLEGDERAGCESLPSKPEPAPVVNKLAEKLDALAIGSEEDSEDAALEAYMSNMMRRMRGDTNEEVSDPPQLRGDVKLNQNSPSLSAMGKGLDRVAPESEAVAEPHDTEPFDMEKLKRTSRKPALPADLTAMRELANSSARRAIAKHYKRLHMEKALGFFLVCLIAICVGGYMLTTASTTREFLSPNFVGGAVAVLVGVVGGFKLLGLLLLAIREGAWEKMTPAKPYAEQSSLPIAGEVESVGAND